jgi:hypothetical protein
MQKDRTTVRPQKIRNLSSLEIIGIWIVRRVAKVVQRAVARLHLAKTSLLVSFSWNIMERKG